MICPKCGYVMEPFEEKCPRCLGEDPPQKNDSPRVSLEENEERQTLPIPNKATTTFPLYAALIIGMIVVISLSYVYWTRTPRYSLIQASNAIERRDFAEFQRYVDIDSVLSFAFDSTAVFPQGYDNNKDSSLRSAKPTFISVNKGKLEHLITNGEINEDTRFDRFSDDNEIRNYIAIIRDLTVKRINKEKDAAFIVLERKGDVEDDATFDIEMRKDNNVWRIYKWDNAGRLLGSIRLKSQEPQPTPIDERALKIAEEQEQEALRSKDANEESAAPKEIRIRPDVLVSNIASKIENASTMEELEDLQDTVSFLWSYFYESKQDLIDRGHYGMDLFVPDEMKVAMDYLSRAIESKIRAARSETWRGSIDKSMIGNNILVAKSHGDVVARYVSSVTIRF